MTHSFITADAARILSANSRTFDALVRDAENAIMETTRTAKINATSIDFTGVDNETWRKFNTFWLERGFRLNLYHLDINQTQSMMRISWF